MGEFVRTLLPCPARSFNARLACLAVFMWLGVLRGFAQQYIFLEYSAPQGIFPTQSNYLAPNATVQTVNAAPTSSGYGFAYWTINGQRVSDAAGQAPTSSSCVMTNDVTAIALYLPAAQETSGSGIPDYLELFYYNSPANAANSDTDDDGFAFSQELARGYDPVIPDTTVNGGEVLRLSNLTPYAPPVNPQYYYVIESSPQGIIGTTGGYVNTNAPVQGPDLTCGITSGYGFGFWTLNGTRQAGPSGAALTQIILPMTNDETAVAMFYAPGQSTSGGLPDWYQEFWFGNLNWATNSDPTGDGFAISDDMARGYCPVVTNATVNGGEILRLSNLTPYAPPANPQYYYVIESSPQGIIGTSSGYVNTNSPVQGPDLTSGITSGYGFGYWTLNGTRQAGPSGAALTQITLPMTNDEIAVAVFYAPGQSTFGGLPDWYQEFWFGNLNRATNSDPAGDGFAISDDMARGYCPAVTNATVNGGEILRLSNLTPYAPPANPQYCYVIESSPQGIIGTTSGCVPTNTPVEGLDITCGITSGYGFGYWTLNGTRQAGPSGAALTQITLPMTNDETAVAVFYAPGQSTAGGLSDWYQEFWFGNLNGTTNSDPTGDGFAISDDVARGYCPVVTNATVNGGEILRESARVIYNPPSRYLVISFVNGQVIVGWSAWGTLQSAPRLNGPYADILGATNPYAMVPQRSQSFFRARFP